MKSTAKKSKSQKGAAMIEYALVAALIAVACIGSVKVVSTKLGAQYDAIGREVEGVPIGPDVYVDE